MNIKIKPQPLFGTIPAIPSKSHLHRLLIASALSKKSTEIPSEITSADIEATRQCLQQFKKDPMVLDCGESGSTLRFLLPVSMALGKSACFLGAGRLPNRPMGPLRQQMELNGCNFFDSDSPGELFTVTGGLQSGTFHLPGDVSSQFITGLLFALPLLSKDSRIKVKKPLHSEGYIDLTLQVLNDFGIQIHSTNEPGYRIYKIKGRQIYKGPDRIPAEGDWSNVAFWIVAGILHPESILTCSGLNLDSRQGDRQILSLARQFGGKVITKDHRIMSTHHALHGIHIDASGIPDLVPILAVAASVAKGITHIHSAQRLRLKESDRLAAMQDCLSRLGGKVKETEDGLIIEGVPSLGGGSVNGYNDHRIVMSMAIASTVCENPVIIEGAEAVKKSYPHFFQDFAKLGGVANEI